jgi:hypothetical protein
VQADRPKPKPKTKPEKPQKAPWEDMLLRKKDDIDAIILDDPPAGSELFEEYYVPLKVRTLMAVDSTRSDCTHRVLLILLFPKTMLQCLT